MTVLPRTLFVCRVIPSTKVTPVARFDARVHIDAGHDGVCDERAFACLERVLNRRERAAEIRERAAAALTRAAVMTRQTAVVILR